MFPELSQKALDEINTASEAFGLFAFGEDYGIVTNPQKAVNAFRSLFDLEKYPITQQQIIDYWDSVYPEEQKGNYPDSWKQWTIAHQIAMITTWRAKKNEIIIIGEIHGWWEKGDANE